jgi:hypothetical protein
MGPRCMTILMGKWWWWWWWGGAGRRKRHEEERGSCWRIMFICQLSWFSPRCKSYGMLCM